MTPGTYLRKRRQSAGLSIDETAMTLAALPVARGRSFNDRCALLKQALIRIEGDAAVMTAAHAEVVANAFPFSIRTYRALATGSAIPRICRRCGCGEDDPCMLDGERLCAPSISEPGLCSICAALSPAFFPLKPGAVFAKGPDHG
jgi:hypothetical protein